MGVHSFGVYNLLVNLHRATQILADELVIQKPPTFSSTWIFRHTPRVYRFARLNLRTVTGEIDWDTITRGLDPEFSKRWVGQRRRGRVYENPDEVKRVLAQYHSKLYIFIAPQNRRDENLRDCISIRLVRVAQRGNTLALKEAVTLIRYAAEEWIERFPMLCRWKYNSDLLEEQIVGCIRRYRFTGSFLGYLYKTLLYSGRGLRPVYSLDEPVFRGSEKTKAENVVQDPETGEIKMYEKGMFSFT
jgi:hypothetical protein